MGFYPGPISSASQGPRVRGDTLSILLCRPSAISVRGAFISWVPANSAGVTVYGWLAANRGRPTGVDRCRLNVREPFWLFNAHGNSEKIKGGRIIGHFLTINLLQSFGECRDYPQQRRRRAFAKPVLHRLG
ncbi:MAG: hypothetical protein KatS3mg110_0852 [Pirellulaceae bacterium]|nr:MAG: hypothetical protein KatS3mg110_0852 [Pirellulaceae bacterium]